jgi:hypothetical protein
LPGRIFCADLEYMLDVANEPILAEKSLKNPFLVKFPKSGKIPPKNNFGLIAVYQPFKVYFIFF